LTVTITDSDEHIRAAIAEVYLTAKPQLYVFHINKNVALYIKRKWNKAEATRVAYTMGLTAPS